MMLNTIIQGDALDVLRTLPDRSVQCVVTSPPYYGLRDYGTAKWEDGSPECDHKKAIEEYVNKNFARSSGLKSGPDGAIHQSTSGRARIHACPACGARRVDDQIGLEETPQAYISKLVAVFAEVRRVLRDDGLLWVNIGDSYANDGKWGGSTSGKHVEALHGQNDSRAKRYTGLKPKNLMMIPARVAIALQDQGWILRSEIVWSKPSAMPESVTDRVTKAHEMVYMFAKSERYYYDAQAIRENAVKGSAGAGARNYVMNIADGAKRYRLGQTEQETTDGRNARSVWTIATQPFKEAHFACMPPKLAERCILASTRPGDVVLDPFSGAGTTALVANNLNRRYIGIELNPDYVSMSRRRLVQPSLDFDWTA